MENNTVPTQTQRHTPLNGTKLRPPRFSDPATMAPCQHSPKAYHSTGLQRLQSPVPAQLMRCQAKPLVYHCLSKLHYWTYTQRGCCKSEQGRPFLRVWLAGRVGSPTLLALLTEVSEKESETGLIRTIKRRLKRLVDLVNMADLSRWFKRSRPGF